MKVAAAAPLSTTLEGLPAFHAPVALIDPHPDNPRRHFEESLMAELTASVKEKGVIEPLLVRHYHSIKDGDRIQIICGERRWRAAKAAGIPNVPVLFRDDLNDEQILEFMLIENIQRADVDELEEAESFEKLLAMHSQYDTSTLALKVSRSVRHVQARLELLRLVPEAKEALRRHKISAGHGQLICRLKAEEQPRALQACFAEVDLVAMDEKEQSLFDEAEAIRDGYGKPKKGRSKEKALDAIPQRLRSVRELDDWIKTHVKADREHLVQQLPELQEAVQEAESEGRKVLEISYLTRNDVNQAGYKYDSRTVGADESTVVAERDETQKALRRIVFAPNWKRADGSKKTTSADDYSGRMVDSKTCEHAVLGVVTFGHSIGQQFKVCVAKKKCKVHWGAELWRAKDNARAYGRPAPDETTEQKAKREAREAAQEKREAAERVRRGKVWAAMRSLIITAVKVAPAGKLASMAAGLVASKLRYGGENSYYLNEVKRQILGPLGVNLTTIEAQALKAHPELARGAEEKAQTTAAKKPAAKKTQKPAGKKRAAKKGRK